MSFNSPQALDVSRRPLLLWGADPRTWGGWSSGSLWKLAVVQTTAGDFFAKGTSLYKKRILLVLLVRKDECGWAAGMVEPFISVLT